MRVFHWATVLLVGLTFLDAHVPALHRAGGIALLGLILLRIGWGFVGGRHARFADFVRGPRTVTAYLNGAIKGRAARFVGHNPAGGAMVLALLATLLVIIATGLMWESDAWFGVRWVIETHKGVTSVLLVLIGLHLGGVALASWQHRENLPLAMLTGRKSVGVRAAPHRLRKRGARAVGEIDRAFVGGGDLGDDREA